MPYFGYSMETRGRWVKLPDGTFGVKTDGPAQRGMVIEVQARSGNIKNADSHNRSALTSGKLSQRKARTVTAAWSVGTTGEKNVARLRLNLSKYSEPGEPSIRKPLKAVR